MILECEVVDERILSPSLLQRKREKKKKKEEEEEEEDGGREGRRTRKESEFPWLCFLVLPY